MSFHVDIDYEPKINDYNYWRQYDIVHFHRSIGQDFDQANSLIQKLNLMGVVTIMDLDDYWLPTKEHPAYHLVMQHKIPTKKIFKTNIKVAKYVTTTTPIFADEIKKYNKMFLFYQMLLIQMNHNLWNQQYLLIN